MTHYHTFSSCISHWLALDSMPPCSSPGSTVAAGSIHLFWKEGRPRPLGEGRGSC